MFKGAQMYNIPTSSPPPKQEPLMAATMGMGDFSTFSNIFWPS